MQSKKARQVLPKVEYVESKPMDHGKFIQELAAQVQRLEANGKIETVKALELQIQCLRNAIEHGKVEEIKKANQLLTRIAKSCEAKDPH